MSNFKKLLSVAGLACLPGMAFADTPTIGSILEASGIAVTGYTSASYSVNFNDGKTLGFRAYDAQSDTFTIDQASITLAYAPESGFGATVNFHTGLRATYKFGDMLSATLGAVNSAPQASTIDANKQKTLEANVMFTPTSTLLVSLTNYLGVDEFDGTVLFPINGPGTGAFTTRTNISDVVVQFTGIDKLTLALNGTLQDAKDLYINKGVAFYGMYQVTEQFAARARIELTEAAVKEAAGGGSSSFKIYTVAGVYSPSKHMDIITEVRYDTSNDDVFPNGLNAPKDTGGNFAVKAIYKF